VRPAQHEHLGVDFDPPIFAERLVQFAAFGVWVLGFGVRDLGFGMWDFGYWGFGFRA